MLPPASPTTRWVGPTRGPTDRPIGSRPPVGGPHAGRRRHAPRGRGELGELLEQMGGVDRLPLVEGGQQADAHVDAPVAHREDPAVAGQDVAALVADVEPAVDPRLVAAGGGVVAADGHAQRVLPVAGGAQLAAEAGVGAVGHDRVAGPDGHAFARGFAHDARPAHQPAFHHRLGGLGTLPDLGPGLPRPLGDELVEVVAGDDVAVGRGCRGARASAARGCGRRRGSADRRRDGDRPARRRGPCPRAGAPSGG